MDQLNNNFISDINIESNIKNELITDMGKDNFNLVYQILNEKLKNDVYNYDYEILCHKIKNYILDDNAYDLAQSKIPDIYCLVLKDQERSK